MTTITFPHDDSAALNLMNIIIHKIDLALREHVPDMATREAIVESAASSIGNLFDQYQFKCDGKWMFPIIGYSENHHDYDQQTIVIPRTSYNESAWGNVAKYYSVENPDDEVTEHNTDWKPPNR